MVRYGVAAGGVISGSILSCINKRYLLIILPLIFGVGSIFRCCNTYCSLEEPLNEAKKVKKEIEDMCAEIAKYRSILEAGKIKIDLTEEQ